mmetsp:Transcript_136183/g.236744  ORF Transcript_136183/g.236744 Transcript_136183/m.236744 type:complete len:165 (+) Transcript_136183:120-614(+)
MGGTVCCVGKNDGKDDNFFGIKSSGRRIEAGQPLFEGSRRFGNQSEGSKEAGVTHASTASAPTAAPSGPRRSVLQATNLSSVQKDARHHESSDSSEEDPNEEYSPAEKIALAMRRISMSPPDKAADGSKTEPVLLEGENVGDADNEDPAKPKAAAVADEQPETF